MSNPFVVPSARRGNRSPLSRRAPTSWVLFMALLAAAIIHTAVATAAERIVSASGPITEILWAIGAEDDVVAVDTSSLFPEDVLRSRPSVGYMRALSAEGVLSTRPTLLLSAEGAGPPDVLKLLREAGVRVEILPDAFSGEALAAKIRRIGALTGRDTRAEALAVDVERRFADLAPLRAAAEPRRILFVLMLQASRAMVGGRNTAADAVIRMVGGINVAAAIDGYKPMTEEAITAAAPDVVLMMVRPGVPAPPAEELFALPAFARTPAATKKAMIAMDGLYLVGFGPREPEAIRDLAEALNRLDGSGR